MPNQTREGEKTRFNHLVVDERPKAQPFFTSRDSLAAIVISVCLIAATLAVYWQVTRFEFLSFDDVTYVSGNEFVKTGINAANVRAAFAFDGYSGNWHPMTWLSLMLDSEICGPWSDGPGNSRMFTSDAGGYHLTNLLLHVTNALLVFVLASWLTGSVWRGGFVAGLFALHPLHVESVAWVAERKDVLSTFFWLLATLSYLCYANASRRSKSATAAFGIWLRYTLLLVFFGLGLMSKAMLVTLPLTLLLLDFWPLKRFDFQAPEEKSRHKKSHPGSQSALANYLPILEKVPLFIMSLLSCIITISVQHKGGAVATMQGITLPMRFATACVACVNYLWKTIWPHHLAAMYPYPVRQNPLTGIVYTISPIVVFLSVLFLASVTAAAFALRRKAPFVLFGWGWYIITLIPVLGLVQVGYQSWADRYTYVPLLGIFVILACGIPTLVRRLSWPPARSPTIAGIVLLGVFGYLAHAQAMWWRDSETLYYHTLDITPDNWFIRNALGRLLLMEDQRIIGSEGVSANAYQISKSAVDQLEKANEVDGGIADIHNNLGVAYRALSLFSAFGEDSTARLGAAIEQFKESLRIDPTPADASLNLAMTLTQLGQQEKAVGIYRQLRNLPDLMPSVAYWARINLAGLLSSKGQSDEAIECLKEAAAINQKTRVDPSDQAEQQLERLGAVRK